MAEVHQAKPPRRHHYVPRLLLNRFGWERKAGKYQTNAFDKHHDFAFVSATENIMVEGDFNSAAVGDDIVSIEGGLSLVETEADLVFRRIVENRHLEDLTETDLETAALFVALQLLRTRAFRAMFADMMVKTRDHLVRFSDGRPLEPALDALPTDNDLKAMSLRIMAQNFRQFTVHVVNKDILLFEAPPDSEFLLGDSAVVMHNDNDLGPYGNLGVAVPGIQIYLPLNTDLLLGFWCPTLLHEQRERANAARKLLGTVRAHSLLGLRQLDPKLVQSAEEACRGLPVVSAIIEAAERGVPVKADHNNMEYFNSLQVSFAERYVVSRGGDFSLVRRMIQDQPSAKHGRRVTVN